MIKQIKPILLSHKNAVIFGGISLASASLTLLTYLVYKLGYNKAMKHMNVPCLGYLYVDPLFRDNTNAYINEDIYNQANVKDQKYVAFEVKVLDEKPKVDA